MHIECIDALMVAQLERICHASENSVSRSKSSWPLKLEFERGNVFIVTATSVDDKTRHFCNVLIHPQPLNDAQSLAFSNEDLGDLGMKLIGHSTMIDESALRSGHLTDPQWPELTTSVQRLRELRCHLVSSEDITAFRLEEICKELANKYGPLDSVLIDSACLCTELQAILTQCAGSKAMSKPFTKLAVQLQCAVVIFHWEQHHSV